MIDKSKFANFVNNMSPNDILQFMLNGFEPESVREYYERLLDNDFINKIEYYNKRDSDKDEEGVKSDGAVYDKEYKTLKEQGIPNQIADIIANLRASGQEVEILKESDDFEYNVDGPDDCDCPACNVRREMFGSNDDTKSMKDILQNLLSQKSKKLN